MAGARAQIEREQIQAAASAGRLQDLARQLILDRAWPSIDTLFGFTAEPAVALETLRQLVETVVETTAALPERRRRPAEKAAVKRLAANALLNKLGPATLPATGAEKSALLLAAGLLLELREFGRAAETFERAGDDVRAADAYRADGAIEQMQRCLARDKAARG